MKKLTILLVFILSITMVAGCKKKDKQVIKETITILDISNGDGSKESPYQLDLNVGEVIDLSYTTNPENSDISVEVVIKSGNDFVSATATDPLGVEATKLNNQIRVEATAMGEHYIRVYGNKAEVFVKFTNHALVNDTSLDMWVLTPYENVFKDFVKGNHNKTSINLVAAKNEFESMQVLLRGNTDFVINDITFSDLVLNDTNKISNENLKYNFVEYAFFQTNTAHINQNQAVRWGADYYPDALSNATSMNVAASETQSIWVTTYIPTNTQAGLYRGIATIHTDQGEIEVFISAEVHDVTVPDSDEAVYEQFIWQRIMGLGHNKELYGDNHEGDSLVDIYGVERYTDEWWSLVGEFADEMRDNRLNIVHVQTMSLLIDAGTTINESGEINFNWTKFDEYIQFFIDKGVMKGLSSDPIMSGDKVYLFKLDSEGRTHTAQEVVTSQTSTDYLNQFIPALNDHLQEKGWLDNWNQSIKDEPMNEVDLANYKIVSDKINDLAPNMRSGDAHVNMHFSNFMFDNVSTIVTLIDVHNDFKTDYGLLLKPDQKIYTYTAVFPGGTYLNRYIDKPVYHGRSIAYYNYNYDVDGYLHWGLMAWYRPITDFANGDTASIYPDPENMTIKSSIRMAAMRDGAEDYELLSILGESNPELAKNIANAIAPDAKDGYATDFDFMVGIREALVRAAAGDTSINFDVEEIQVNQNDIALGLGDTEQLVATILPTRALNKAVQWISSDPSVVTVSEQGMLTALKSGTATITVSSVENGTVKKTVNVTVGVDADTSLLRSIGDATVQDGIHTNVNMGGSPNISVKSDNTSFKRNFYIKFETSSITKGVVDGKVKLYADSIGFAGTRMIDVYKTPIEWDQDSITWASGPEAIVKIGSMEVTNDGTNTGWFEFDVTDIINPDEGALSLLFVDNGPTATDAMVSFVSKEGASNQPMLIVRTGQVTSVTDIQMDTTPLNLNPGSKRQLIADVLPGSVTNKRLIWESSNSDIVKVTDNGEIFAIQEGTATIKVSSLSNPSIFKEVEVTVELTGVQIITTSDGTVTNGANADKSYHGEDGLLIKADANSFFRKAFIQFDLSDLSGTLEEAVVMLNIKGIGSLGTKSIEVYKVSNTWNEETLSWNNSPADGEKITTFTVTNDSSEVGRWVPIDVTDYIDLEEGKISLLLVNNGQFHSQSNVLFHSKEATSHQPKLIVSGDIEYDAPAIEEINVDRTSATIKEGETLQLSKSVYPLNADNSLVSWTSSDESVATVDANGSITTLTSGTTTIKVASIENPSIFAEVTLNVVKEIYKFISVDDATLRDGSYGNNNDGIAKDIAIKLDGTSYSRSAVLKFNFAGITGDIDFAIARVNVALVNAASPSRAVKVSTIGNDWDELSVTWNERPELIEEVATFNVSSSSGVGYWIDIDVTQFIKEGDTEISLYFEVTSPRASGSNVTFSSKEADANWPELLISGNVAYEAPEITEITTNKKQVTLEEGLTSQLQVTGMRPHLTNDNNVVWSSSDETVLTVDQSGFVTTHKYGTAKVNVASATNPLVFTEIEFRVLQEFEGDFTKQFKVLAIGNSFSEDALEYLYQIAADFGYENIIIGHLVIGGSPIDLHANNALTNSPAYTYAKNTTGTWTRQSGVTMLEGITDEKWDLITIQQVSGLSGKPETYQPHLTTLVNYINQNKLSASAKIGWHMTWAYQKDSSHPDFPSYGKDQTLMYNFITNAVQQNVLTHGGVDMIIPSGTTIQNIRSSYIGDTLTRDGYHLNYGVGRYAAAMTWFKQITGQNIDDITWAPSGVSLTDMMVVKEAVNNAYAHQFQPTNSSYPTIDSIISSFADTHNELLYTTEIGFWNSTNNNNLETVGDLAKKYLGTELISKEELPVGSIIVIAPGYQYRNNWFASPDGPTSEARRSNNTTSQIVIIDEAWWGSQNYVSFNLSKLGTPYVADIRTDIVEAFTIYTPKQ